MVSKTALFLVSLWLMILLFRPAAGIDTCADTQELRKDILEDFGVEVRDDCVLDSEQLEVIYRILEAVPEDLYGVTAVTTHTEEKDNNVICVKDVDVGASKADAIPDGVAQYADVFSLNFIRSLSSNIRERFIKTSDALSLRERSLIQDAGKSKKNYIRSDYSDGFFLQKPHKFFPLTSEAYFQDSNLTLALALRRFREGYKSPLDQFLFLASAYSPGPGLAVFYRVSEDGVIETFPAEISRDGNGRIISLKTGETEYGFMLDENGSVTEVTEHPLARACPDGTYEGSCSPNKPYLCENGILRPNCSVCGCSDGFDCMENGYCIKSVAECVDGTPDMTCSEDKPLYCSNGVLVERCDICNCTEGECQPDGKCNNPPVLKKIGNKEVREGEELKFKIHAEDPDGDYITFFVSGLPEGAEFDKKTGTFSWTPDYDQTGNYWVTFAVVDDRKIPLSDHETIRITVGDVNRPPDVEAPESLRTDENILVEFKIHAEDPDGDEIYYHAANIPEGAEFDTSTGKFSWIPGFDQEGNYELVFSVSDGKENVSVVVHLSVGRMNRPPESRISYPLENQKFLTGRGVLFSAFGSRDPDRDKLTYIWDFGDGKILAAENLTVFHVYENPGEYTVTLSVTDGNMSDSDSVTIMLERGVMKDSDGDGVDDSLDRCPGTSPFRKVNIYGCPLPRYEKFANDLTTNFTLIDLTNATDVSIGIPGKGKIEFRKNRINLVDKDIDRYVKIGDMNVTIETEKVPELNKSAVITFYNVTIENPVITKDGIYCSECKVISYVNRTFMFSVPHFTTYSLMTWASYSGYCGDGMCSLYETCYDCREDCGECREEEKKPGVCKEMWVCSAWSECNELNLRTRECTDVNLCGTESNKPAEAVECGRGQDTTSLILFGFIIISLLILYLLAETYRRKRESRKMDRFELERFVKGYVYRGYAKSEIKKLLKSQGYTEKEINRVLKEVEKEIF